MRTIKEHIKNKTFKNLYLLYGEETYLKNLYKKKLKEAILCGSDDMNYNYFEGKNIDASKVIEISETLPFFAEKRLIIIENSGWFKSQSSMPDYISALPETTYFVFVENEVDKRNRLYKTVKEAGTVVQMNGLDEKNLKLWLLSLLNQEKKKITEKTLSYILEKTGNDMGNMNNEIEKLISYTSGREVITVQDVDAVCITQISNRIFQMIDAVASKNQSVALKLYYDLLELKEKPMSILFLITRHFNQLMQVKELANMEQTNAVIAKKAGIPPFAVNKYLNQSRFFSINAIKTALNNCADVEERVKTGKLSDIMGVELLIVAFSTKAS